MEIRFKNAKATILKIKKGDTLLVTIEDCNAYELDIASKEIQKIVPKGIKICVVNKKTSLKILRRTKWKTGNSQH